MGVSMGTVKSDNYTVDVGLVGLIALVVEFIGFAILLALI